MSGPGAFGLGRSKRQPHIVSRNPGINNELSNRLIVGYRKGYMVGVSERRAGRVVVCDRVPIRRRALTRAVEQLGFAPVEVAHIDLTADEPAGTVVVWSCDEDDLTSSSDLCLVGEDTRVVALLSDPSPDRYRQALRLGASSVASLGASPHDLVTLISLAQEGWAIVPVGVARELAGDQAEAEPRLAPHEVEWLTKLAAGVVVRNLAVDSGVSEREIYRALHAVYEKLGAVNRVEAIVVAARLGLLDRAVL